MMTTNESERVLLESTEEDDVQGFNPAVAAGVTLGGLAAAAAVGAAAGAVAGAVIVGAYAAGYLDGKAAAGTAPADGGSSGRGK